MLPSIVSAALSLGLALTAAPPAAAHKTSVTHAKYVTVSDGFTTKKVKLPTIHHYPHGASKSSNGSADGSSGNPAKPAGSNGCYEVTAKFGLVPCGSHPHR